MSSSHGREVASFVHLAPHYMRAGLVLNEFLFNKGLIGWTDRM